MTIDQRRGRGITRIVKERDEALAEVARLRGIIEGLECYCSFLRDQGNNAICQACGAKGTIKNLIGD